MSKRAILLAGGKGTRLRPYTISIPKPLVPIGDKPIIEIIITQLAKYGFQHITLTINHMGEIIKAFCGDGSKWRVKIDYSVENQPLNTMGPLKLIRGLPDDFLVMNGDILTDLNFKKFYELHRNNRNLFSISSYVRTHIQDYGVLKVNNQNELIEFKEKPNLTYEVSMGVYMLNKEVLTWIPDKKSFGFDQLMKVLLENNKRVHVYKHKSYWMDIGRPDDYEKATLDYNNKLSI